MNIRHAAALALVGWYLMLPPRTSDVGPFGTFDESAPLSKWKIAGSYDSAAACNQGQEDTLTLSLKVAERESDEGKKEQFLQQVASLLKAQKCIASDDPRLAK